MLLFRKIFIWWVLERVLLLVYLRHVQFIWFLNKSLSSSNSEVFLEQIEELTVVSWLQVYATLNSNLYSCGLLSSGLDLLLCVWFYNLSYLFCLCGDTGLVDNLHSIFTESPVNHMKHISFLTPTSIHFDSGVGLRSFFFFLSFFFLSFTEIHGWFWWQHRVKTKVLGAPCCALTFWKLIGEWCWHGLGSTLLYSKNIFCIFLC